MSRRRDWSRRTESASLALPAALVAQARKNSRQHGDAALLAMLAHEIAATRGPELTLAYRNVVAVAAGFRQRGEGAARRMTAEPCVIFIVRRKWTRDEVGMPHQQALPRWLVAYAERDGERRPFAVATDVQPEAGFGAPRAHGGAVWAQRANLPRAAGALACAVDLHTAQGTQRCVLSALHVLTPRPDLLSPGPQRKLPILPFDATGGWLHAPTLATSLRIGGRLRPEEDPAFPSFDVQLASADLPHALRDVVGAPRLHAGVPFVRSFEQLVSLAAPPARLALVVPANHPTAPGRPPIRLRLSALLPAPFAIEYGVCRGESRTTAWIFHEGLLKLDPDGAPAPVPGDSGSPVVLSRPDGSATLVGLHIGKADGASLAIPAWQLFDLARYWTHPPGATLEPVSI
jgi:hypothetical protein